MSTTGNNSQPSSARPLIKETTMRLTTASTLAAVLFTTACVPTEPRKREPTDTQRDCSKVASKDLKKVEQDLTITSTDDLEDLPSGCLDVFGTVRIEGADITSLADLDTIVGVNHLELVGTRLTTIDTPRPIKVYGSVIVVDNDQLRGLKNLATDVEATDIEHDLVIDQNNELADLESLAARELVKGDVVITNNPKLPAVKLPMLHTVEGSVQIASNAALTQIDLARLAKVHTFEISNNTALTSLSGIAATQLDGSFIVRGNRALTTLGAMSSLSNVLGSVEIDNNDALTSLGGFATSVRYVTGVLSITDNAVLTDLGQTSRMLGIGSIRILNNTNLSFCRAQEVDHCVPQHAGVTIQNNKPDSNCDCWCD